MSTRICRIYRKLSDIFGLLGNVFENPGTDPGQKSCTGCVPVVWKLQLVGIQCIYNILFINHLRSFKCMAIMLHLGFIFVPKNYCTCISQFVFRISLIRNGDRIPSHEQVVIQEYIDRVSTGFILHQSNFSFV